MKKYIFIACLSLILSACQAETEVSVPIQAPKQTQSSQEKQSALDLLKESEDQDSTSAPVTQSPDQAEPVTSPMTLDQALAWIQEQMAGLAFKSIKVERLGQGWIFEVEAQKDGTAYAWQIDSQTGQVLKADEWPEANTVPLIDYNQVLSLNQVQQLSQENGVQEIDTMELRADDQGQWIWIVDDSHGLQLIFDGLTGELLSPETAE